MKHIQTTYFSPVQLLFLAAMLSFGLLLFLVPVAVFADEEPEPIIGSISGYKWDDLNGNGEWDGGEPGMSGVTIELDGDEEDTITTDSDGYYEFTGLEEGDYSVDEEVPADYIQSFPTGPEGYSVSIEEGSENVTDLNFGNYKEGLMKVCKYDATTDELLDDWLMTVERWSGDSWEYVLADDTGDDGDGCVEFDELDPGEYRVSEEMQEGWERVSPEGEYIEFTVNSGFDNTDDPFEFRNQEDNGDEEPPVDEDPPVDEEPEDVCPNIEGDQETVPEGYELVDGECVLIEDDTPPEEEEPVDVCPNIEGDQETVPEGHELVDGECVLIDEGGDGGDEDNGDDTPPAGGGGGSSSGSGGGGGGLGLIIEGLAINEEMLQVVEVDQTSVIISWLTNEPSSSQVLYATADEKHALDVSDDGGDPPTYGYAHTTPEYDTDPMVTFHTVTITGLTPNTIYYFRAVSRASPPTFSEEHAFLTLMSEGGVGDSGNGGELLAEEETTDEELPTTGGDSFGFGEPIAQGDTEDFGDSSDGVLPFGEDDEEVVQVPPVEDTDAEAVDLLGGDDEIEGEQLAAAGGIGGRGMFGAIVAVLLVIALFLVSRKWRQKRSQAAA